MCGGEADGDVLLIIIPVLVRMVGSGNSILEDIVITSCLFEQRISHCCLVALA